MEETPDDVESYQSELSEKVSEGGGCAETWDALTEMRGDMNDRRTVMKGLLGLVGGILGSGVASASEGASEGGVRVDAISGRRRERILSRALSDVEYTTLIEALEDDGYRGSSIEENVYSVKPSHAARYSLVSVVLELEGGAIANIVLSPDGSPESRAGVFTRDDSGRPLTIEEYRFKDTFADGSDLPKSIPLEVASNELSVGEATVFKQRIELAELWQEGGTTTNISTEMATSASSDFCDDFPDDIGCGTCKNIVRLLNSVTCSIETVAACAIITSETGVGPVACVIAVGALCFIIQNFGWAPPQRLCEDVCACG